MTNHWIDMINADVVLIMGGNPAEDHPYRNELAGAGQGAAAPISCTSTRVSIAPAR